MASAQAGPVYFPWEGNHPEEVVIFLIAGILGAIIGATLITHFRRLQGRA